MHEDRYFQQMSGLQSDLWVDRCITYKNIHIKIEVAVIVIANPPNEDELNKQQINHNNWKNHPTFNDKLFMYPCKHDQLSAHAVRTDHLLFFMLSGQCSWRSFGQSNHDFRGRGTLFPVSLGSSSPSRPGNAPLEGLPLPPAKEMREHGEDPQQEHNLANRSRTRLSVTGNGRIVRHFCSAVMVWFVNLLAMWYLHLVHIFL